MGHIPIAALGCVIFGVAKHQHVDAVGLPTLQPRFGPLDDFLVIVLMSLHLVRHSHKPSSSKGSNKQYNH